MVFFVTLNSLLVYETANKVGLEPGSWGPKAAMLTIKLHSIDTYISLLALKTNFKNAVK